MADLPEPLDVRFDPIDVAKIDEWIALHGGGMTRPEAVSRLVSIGLGVVQIRQINVSDIPRLLDERDAKARP